MLVSSSEDTAIVGFAMKEGDKWRRIGWDQEPGNDAPLTMGVKPGLKPPLEVIAVPCVGYRQPLGHGRIFSVRRGSAGSGPPYNPDQPLHEDSGQAACDLPERRPTGG